MLTVLLATRNRSGILRSVLESYCLLQSPLNGWKLVVVDNGSTDDTPGVLASFRNRLPLTSLSEPTLGKNCALNTGLEFVDGDLAVFADDDAFPNPDWLVRLEEAAEKYSACSMFGGKIVPRWEAPPPPWIGWLELGPIFTVTPPTLREGELPSEMVPNIYGPNMAIRADVFRSGIRFDTSIGPRGSSYPMGSETELLVRLSRQGHRACHVQSAIVEHFVRKEQMDKTWVLQRAIRLGRGRFRMSPHVKLWMGVPRHLFRDIPRELSSMALAALSFREDAVFLSRWRLNILRGKAVEARTMTREQRAAALPTGPDAREQH